MMSCGRALLCAARSHCYITRFQHGGEVAALNNSLPSNLVLFGISKEKVAEKEIEQEIQPPSDSVPLVRSCIDKIPRNRMPILVWVDNLASAEQKFETAAQLHPSVFGVHPRMDVLHTVVRWQKLYREVDYAWSRTRAEMGRGKRKPWPQKGTGLKRQGSRTPPFWKGGGICHGPRGPRSLFYEIPQRTMVQGLMVALTVKLIQNDLLVVDNLELPGGEFDGFRDFVDNRGLSENTMLLIHPEDNFPRNLSSVVQRSRTASLMPAFALNVWSILKHDKLVLPVEILDDLEQKLLWTLNRYDWLDGPHNFYKDMPGTTGLKADQNSWSVSNFFPEA